MTGYHISIGYQSGGDPNAAWEALKEETLYLCRNAGMIAMEAIRYGMRADQAQEYTEPFLTASLETSGTEDSTLRIIEGERAEGKPQIMMLAGGSGDSRTLKEAVRRAFCRLILERMHKRGIEININVA